MIKAPRLQQGDTIGIVSPSWGGAGAFPHRVQLGLQQMQALGFKVKIADHALNQHGYVSDTAENRVADIHAMFAADEVKAIVAAIGGDHSCHLLPLLDFELIRTHPKIFIGYSDITVLNVAIQQATGLVTFNGPALLTDWAEWPQMFDYTRDYLLKALTEAQPIGEVAPSSWWTEEFLDWAKQLDTTRPRTQLPSAGWTWLKQGVAEGRLLGGCIDSLQHLRGTPYWPRWDETILFFETSEEKPTPAEVDGILMDYENMGVLAKLKGMLVGRPYGYSDSSKQQLRDVLLARTAKYDFPIIADMDFGHTAPQFTLPLGCRARIDSNQQRFAIVEVAIELGKEQTMAAEVINLAAKFGQFSEYWSPKVVGELNDSYVKVVKLKGEFVWHHHEAEDELFLVVKGRLLIQLRDGDRWLNEGEFIIIPKMVEHRPVAEDEVQVILIEPKTTVNTGNVTNELTATLERI